MQQQPGSTCTFVIAMALNVMRLAVSICMSFEHAYLLSVSHPLHLLYHWGVDKYMSMNHILALTAMTDMHFPKRLQWNAESLAVCVSCTSRATWREGIDVPLVYEKGKCRHEQLQSAPPPSLSRAPTRLYPQRFLLAPRQRLMTLQAGLGPIAPSLLFPYKWRLSVFIVRRVTQQPADGGLPRPRWKGRASFRNALACMVTHGHTGRVHYTITYRGVSLCVCV